MNGEQSETTIENFSGAHIKRRSGAFTDNMKLPVHRWFRYSAGFSAEWVEEVLRERERPSGLKVLDPFCGSGTTLLAASAQGLHATGFEAHPFITRIARTKTRHVEDTQEFENHAAAMVAAAEADTPDRPSTESSLLQKCYTEESLVRLEALRAAFEKIETADRSVIDLLWLTLTSILRECSGVGTAQWQYVLPNKSKARVADPFIAFRSKAAMIAKDLQLTKSRRRAPMTVLETDARAPNCEDVFDLAITSPPYPNNYDYADATRLEMTFWGEVASWGDLQKAVRQYLIRACSQHSAAERLVLDEYLEKDVLAPIRDDIAGVCRELDEVRQSKGGKKTYHTMVAAYFADLAEVWLSLRRLVATDGEVAFVIGDSAPYGVYVPCDEWLGKLALAAGFSEYRFEKFRDRNIKWKNRKHRVPLKEGVLWVKG